MNKPIPVTNRHLKSEAKILIFFRFLAATANSHQIKRLRPFQTSEAETPICKPLELSVSEKDWPFQQSERPSLLVSPSKLRARGGVMHKDTQAFACADSDLSDRGAATIEGRQEKACQLLFTRRTWPNHIAYFAIVMDPYHTESALHLTDAHAIG
jgi:hypothetical protein